MDEGIVRTAVDIRMAVGAGMLPERGAGTKRPEGKCRKEDTGTRVRNKDVGRKVPGRESETKMSKGRCRKEEAGKKVSERRCQKEDTGTREIGRAHV